ncbi:MAG: hypothetical protein HRU40_09525 [Saprospiraceae bacterium]|nr:hypothetical protein [Saprospiraceae bacterium]
MRLSKYILVLGMAITVSTVAVPSVAHAQCPMCKMSAESNLQNGGSAGKGLNNGILYMLATPYLLIGAVGYVWYRNRRRKEEEELVFDED